MEAKRGLSPRLVVALDAARALAAIYVVLHHVAATYHLGGFAGIAFRFGQEAVLAFFLLSGFVIFANERTRALHPRGYVLRRIRRIYPPLMVAIAVSTLVAYWNGNLVEKFSTAELIGTLLNLQDIAFLKPGVIVEPFMGNDPLWSLSYEMFFYLLFPFVVRAWASKPHVTDHVVGAVTCLAYASYAIVPNHFSLVLAYFQLWWCGAMAADSYLRGFRDIRGMATSFSWLLALCATAAIVVALEGSKGLGYYPVLPLRHFAAGAVLLILCYGPLGRSAANVLFSCASVFSFMASISYGLYVLHFPLLISWKEAHSLPGTVVACVMLLTLSYIAERQLPRILPKAPRD